MLISRELVMEQAAGVRGPALLDQAAKISGEVTWELELANKISINRERNKRLSR